MSGLTINDERLRKRLEEEGVSGQYGINSPQDEMGGYGVSPGGESTETGINPAAVKMAKETDIFTANKVFGETSLAGGAANLAANVTDTSGTGVQADIVPNQTSNGVVVADGGVSGLQSGAHALTGTTKNDPQQQQGGATDDQRHERYQASQEGNLTSIAFQGSPDGAIDTTPAGVGGRLGAPSAGGPEGKDGAGDATLTTSDKPEAEKPSGEATFTATDGPKETDETGTETTDTNVGDSGNKDNKKDSSNGITDKSDPSSENYNPNSPENINDPDNPNSPNNPSNPENPENPANPSNPENPENIRKAEEEENRRAA